MQLTNNAVAACVDMGGTKIYGTLIEVASGRILYEHRIATKEGDAAPEDRLMLLIDHLLAQPLSEGQQVTHIGVGVPGVVTSAGEVMVAPNIGWTRFPLLATLQTHSPLPVAVENDVNLAALGEYRYGAAQGSTSMICIAVGTGIGSGIVINGQLIRGHTYSAGEVGYMIPGREFLGKVYDTFGAMEYEAAGPGIARRGSEAAGREVTTGDVFDAARKQEAWAVDVIDETLDYLALTLANSASVLDPEIIVLSGGAITAAPDLFLEPLHQRVQGLTPFTPSIVASTLGAQAATLGAAALQPASK
jgi:glucokinase